jgi:hypothetical protein
VVLKNTDCGGCEGGRKRKENKLMIACVDLRDHELMVTHSLEFLMLAMQESVKLEQIGFVALEHALDGLESINSHESLKLYIGADIFVGANTDTVDINACEWMEHE